LAVDPIRFQTDWISKMESTSKPPALGWYQLEEQNTSVDKKKNRYFATNGAEVIPPPQYASLFETITVHDEWMFNTFHTVRFTRRYRKGEFWPVIAFNKPDSSIWVDVVKHANGMTSRYPLGVNFGFMDGVCDRRN
jgi:hypothetical protein